jgi:DNA-binding transcriptional ArsR family regulator
MPTEQLREDLAEVWQGDAMPPAVAKLIAEGPAGSRRLADALADYWSIAIEQHWPSMRSILDDDVAHRAGELTRGGVNAMLADLHDQVSIQDEVLRIDKVHSAEEDLSGAALKLVPSVFAWPNIIFAAGTIGSPSLTYPARGVGRLWESTTDASEDEDALAALLGRSRAAILTALVIPQSTTQLSVKLSQSTPAVSQHLSVLRRSGLVTSWRSGRSVLYRQTALASSIVQASTPSVSVEKHA